MAGNIIEYIAKIFKSLNTMQLDKLDEDVRYFQSYKIPSKKIREAVIGIASLMEFENKNPASKKGGYGSEG